MSIFHLLPAIGSNNYQVRTIGILFTFSLQMAIDESVFLGILHYENTPLQYIDFSYVVKIENFL